MRGGTGVTLLAALSIAAACGSKPAERASSAASASDVAIATAALARARTPTHPTACALVSADEMGRILDGALGAPVAKEGPDTTSCRYAPAADGAITPYAQVDIDWDAGEETMVGGRVAAKVMGRDAGMSVSEPIEGLGDEASTMIGGVTLVRKDRTLIQVTLGGQSHAKEKRVAIAKVILTGIDRAHS